MKCRALLPAMAVMAMLLPALGNVAFMAMAAPGPSPSPNPIPAMAMALDPSGVTTYPTDVQIGVAKVSGSVIMDKVPGERLIVALAGSIDTGWFVQCTPSQLVFTTNKITTFSVNIVVPMGTLSSQVGVLTIQATGSGVGFTLHTMSQVLITVAPFYLVYLDSPLAFKEVTPAHSTQFTVELKNWGNAQDSYDLYVQNLDELANKGWTVTFSSSSVARVGAMQSKFVTMFVQPAFTSTAYKYESTPIMVTAVSQNSRDTGGEVKQAVFQFVVCERGTYIDASTWFSLTLLIIVLVPITLGTRHLLRRRKARRALRAAAPKDD